MQARLPGKRREHVIPFGRSTRIRDLESGAVPLLLRCSLGKAQEVLCALDGGGLQPKLHGSVYAMTRNYEQVGQTWCPDERYHPGKVKGKVLICPPNTQRSRMLEKI